MTNRGLYLASVAAAMILAACSRSDAPASQATETSDATLAETLARGEDFAAIEGMIENAGFAGVMDGTGPYTIFAPPEAAIAASAGGGDFSDDALKAQAAALLRAHIVPGALTRADIEEAVERAGPDGAQMRTMTGGLLTFRRDGDVIVVEGPDGARARLSGREALARNGVLQPIDGLLLQASTADS